MKKFSANDMHQRLSSWPVLLREKINALEAFIYKAPGASKKVVHENDARNSIFCNRLFRNHV